jgi:hypothetical protein
LFESLTIQGFQRIYASDVVFLQLRSQWACLEVAVMVALAGQVLALVKGVYSTVHNKVIFSDYTLIL